EYSVQLTFREQWLDERLRFSDYGGRLKYLTLTDASRVWMPDLFFSNEKEGHFHNIIMPNVYIRIFPNGSVLYSIRISLTLSCPMNLKLYPLDRQVCSLRMASCEYTNISKFLTVGQPTTWYSCGKRETLSKLLRTCTYHGSRWRNFIPTIATARRTPKSSTRSNREIRSTFAGEYSCLKVDLLFKREFSYYLIQIYIPCCMLVIVSWVSFWLDQSAVPARVSLGVTTLLTMATQTSGINASLPPVSYTKAIDIWTGVCLTFVFGALLEFALVNYASRSDMHSDNIEKKYPPSETEQSTSMDLPSDQVEPDNSSNFAMTGYDGPLQNSLQKPLVRQPEDTMSMDRMQHCELHMQPRKKNCCRSWLSKFPTRSKRIDVISRIFFPIVFAFFNLAYWSTYLFREEEQDEHKQHHHPQRYHLHQHPHQQQQPRSASFSSLHNVIEGTTTITGCRCTSPTTRSSRHSLKSLARSSPSPSPSPTPTPTPTPSPSPTTSRRATPSPPAATVRAIPPHDTTVRSRFQRLPVPPRGGVPHAAEPRCCWGLLPKRWFTCRAKGTAGIDFVSRIAFPLMFLLFNLGYWSTYLFHGDDAVQSQN
ncbi:hypothetical protein E2986_06603, partial [Frieseomelitta varia]